MPLLKKDELRRLAADETITTLTVDTSIFREKRLQLNSGTLQALKGMARHGFRFILSGTVAKEVELQMENAAKDALRNAKKGVGEALGAFETKKPTRDEILEQITGGLEPKRAAEERFSKYVRDTNCEVLVDSKRVDTAALFERYFSVLPPFHEGRKKSEFPDALALMALEDFAEELPTGMLVVSKDRDWELYCANSKFLYHASEINDALDLVTNVPPRFRHRIFCQMIEDENDEIFKHLYDKVAAIEFSAIGIPAEGECELYPGAVALMGVHWPQKEEIDIIELDPLDVGETIRLVVSVSLDVLICFSVEVMFGIWDSEYHELLPTGLRTLEVDHDDEILATLTFHVHNQGSENEVWEVVDVEIDTKDIEVNLGEIGALEAEDYIPLDH